MPHIPRPSSLMSSIPPELMHQARVDHKPIPITKPTEPVDKEPEDSRSLSIGLETISPHSYKPNQDLIFRTLLGKEPHVDPNTGQLVSSAQPNRTTT